MFQPSPQPRRFHLPRTCGWLLLILSLTAATGCQSLHPFAQRTRQRIESAKNWAQGGLEALQCGRLQQAKGLFARASAQSPHDFRVRANLARTLHQSGETAEAIAQMELAVQQAGSDPAMHVELGQMYLDVEQFAPASRQANVALRANHQFAPAWTLTGKIHRARGDLDLALADFQRAAGMAPEDLSVQMDIAETYRALEEPQKALASLEHLLAEHPVDRQPDDAIIARADLLMEIGQTSAALASLQRARQNQPGSEAILYHLATLQISAGQYARAQSSVAAARQQFPDDSRFDALERSLQQAGQRGLQRVAAFAPRDSLSR